MNTFDLAAFIQESERQNKSAAEMRENLAALKGERYAEAAWRAAKIAAGLTSAQGVQLLAQGVAADVFIISLTDQALRLAVLAGCDLDEVSKDIAMLGEKIMGGYGSALKKAIGQ